MTVTQEVHFAHHLAANEKVTRDRALRKLTRWIRAKSAREDTEFTEEALMKLWKGLFFCMWMSDKPFVQQDLANNIAGLIHCFAQRSQALLFIDTFFKTMAHEWFAIDRFRLEKFMMLVRRFFRQGLVLAYAGEWKDENIVEFCEVLKATALHPSRRDVPLGLKMHVVDIFLQELSRVHGGKLTSEQAELFLQPFFDVLTDSPAGTLVEFVRNNVFFLMIDLDREAAELEQEGEVPNLDEEGEEKDSDEEEDTYDEHGRVMEKGESSQDLPAIPFDYERIANKLFECTKRHALKPANRLVITRLVKKYRSILQEGLLKPPALDDDQGDIITEKEVDDAAIRLEQERLEELERERQELQKLKEGRSQAADAQFGFDSTSGAYEYQRAGSDDDGKSGSESDADDDTTEDDEEAPKSSSREAKKRKKRGARAVPLDEENCGVSSDEEPLEAKKASPKKRVRRRLRKFAVPEASSLDETGHEGKECSHEDEAEREIGALLENRVSKSKRKRGGSMERVGDDLGGDKPESLKKARKRRRKIHVEPATSDSGQGVEATGSSEHDIGEGISKKVAKKSGVNGMGSGFPGKKQKLYVGKKVERLVLGKAPRKKSILKNKGGFAVVSNLKATKKNGSALPAKVESKDAGVSLGPKKSRKVRKQEALKRKQEQVSNGTPDTFEPKTESPKVVGLTGTETAERKRVPLITLTKRLDAKGPIFSIKPESGSPAATQSTEAERGQFQVSTPTAAVFRKCLSKVQSEKPYRMKRMAPTEKFSLSFQGEKKVNFALSRNKSQDPREYFETLKNSPEIPFDASRKPVQGVLKTNMSQTPAGVKSQKRSRASDFF